MRFSRLLPIASLLFLAACSGSGSGNTSLSERLQNPLYAQKYYEDLVTHMVSLQIHDDPILKNSAAKSAIDHARADGVQRAQDAAKMKDQGPHGTFISDGDEVQGSVLIANGMLYLGPDFFMAPGPSTHLFLT